MLINENDNDFYSDLNAAITKIRIKNYKGIVIEKLVPYIRELTLNNDNYLITDNQALEQAHQLFLQGKNSGKIDILNSIVPEDDILMES